MSPIRSRHHRFSCSKGMYQHQRRFKTPEKERGRGKPKRSRSEVIECYMQIVAKTANQLVQLLTSFLITSRRSLVFRNKLCTPHGQLSTKKTQRKGRATLPPPLVDTADHHGGRREVEEQSSEVGRVTFLHFFQCSPPITAPTTIPRSGTRSGMGSEKEETQGLRM